MKHPILLGMILALIVLTTMAGVGSPSSRPSSVIPNQAGDDLRPVGG